MSPFRHLAVLLAVVSLEMPGLRLMAAEAEHNPATAYTAKAMALLRENCLSCHNPEKKKGGLILSTRERAVRGGDTGPAIKSGKARDSLLIQSLAADADPHMPPKKQLAETQIATLRNWIEAGAAWDEKVLNAPVARAVPAEFGPLPTSYQPALALALSPDEKTLVIGRGGRLFVHDVSVPDRPLVKELAAHRDAVQSLAWSSDGRWLASGGFRKVVIWDARTWTPGRELTNELTGRITALGFTPDDHSLVLADSVASQSGWIRVVDPASGEQKHSWQAHGDSIHGLSISADGKLLATAGADRMVRLWDFEKRTELGRMERHQGHVLAVAFNPDGSWLASGATEKELKIWDVKTRQEIINISKLNGAVTGLRWAADGKSLLSVGEDGMPRVFTEFKAHGGAERSDGAKERTLPGVEGALQAVATTADGKTIYGGGQDGVVQVWGKDGKLAGTLTEAPAKATTTRVPPPSFTRDVMPILSKAGCSAGSCHAKPEGQNGFKLSVFAYDPKGDYREIVQEDRGRRLFPAFPEASLLLKKATLAVDHEGGQRFEPGSEFHKTLVEWIRAGMPYRHTNEPSLTGIAVEPAERRATKGAKHTLKVKARYADGSTRDVTGLAEFSSGDAGQASVDHDGRVTAGRTSGEGVIIARFMGQVGVARVIVPADRVLPASRYVALPVHNAIDTLTYERLKKLGHLPSEGCTDAEFIRRASLDAIGRLPTVEEARAFLAECGTLDTASAPVPPHPNPLPQGEGTKPSRPERTVAESTSSKSVDGFSLSPGERAGVRGKASVTQITPRQQAARNKLIDRLLADPAYGDFWANKWADLVRPNPDRVGVKSVYLLDQWLRDSFRQNKPYDQFAREIILAEGSTHRDAPTVIYRDRREPADLTTMFSQVFLGVRMECAKCHNHPNEKWGMNDFYQMAAFFGPLKRKGAGVSPPISAGTEHFYFAPGGTVKNPVTSEVMKPKPPDGPVMASAENEDPRRALADWMTQPDNPHFARAVANRIWAEYFGRGIVDPVDDFRVSNPPSNGPLLDALAAELVRSKFDLKQLMRFIMRSHVYQLSSTPNDTNLADTKNFSRAYRRRLPAEVLLDAVNSAAGVTEKFAGLPAGSRAMQGWTYKMDSEFMDAFNRPNSSSDCPCERDRSTSVVQSLHLMNSKSLQAKLASADGRMKRLAASTATPPEIVTELYLAAFSRTPTPAEVQIATKAFESEGATRQTATEDIAWALLNSAEFVFNH